MRAAGLRTGQGRMMSDRFTYPKSGRSTQRHTPGPVCHFLISCCSVLKPLLPLCREWTLCSFLFVMLITLSLTVPHFSCQLAFILFCFFFPPQLTPLSFSAVYRQPSWGAFKSLPASLAAPGTNYIMQQPSPFQFLQRAGTDRNLDLLSLPAASHLSLRS